MKRAVRTGCVLAFLLLCAAVLAFLHAFTQTEGGTRYVGWDRAAVVTADGAERPFDPLEERPDLPEGAYYRFTAALPERSASQWLIFSISGAEAAVELDGGELYRSAAAPTDQAAAGQGQVQLPLPPGGGEVLTLSLRPLGRGPDLFPPSLRLTADPTDQAGTISYANRSAFPAGAFALALALVWGLFLLGVAFGTPDWSLLPLCLATACLMVYRLSQSTGYYFLPQPLLAVFTWPGLGLLTALALAVYLVMNRRRNFWRLFGWAALCSAAALLAAFLLSLACRGRLAAYMQELVVYLFRYGAYDALSYWLGLWLVAVCTLLSAVELVRSMARTQAQARAAQVKYQLTLENSQEAAHRNHQTAALRHEWKNQLVALHLLLQKGDLEGLGRCLEQLEGDLGRLGTRHYTDQVTVNTILQNIDYRAEKMGVAFHCQAMIPGDLQFDEEDLCALLLNMLDNALEAAAKVNPPRRREVHCNLKVAQGFLVIWCENTYTGALHTDHRGRLLTSKENREEHGFGLSQMQQVAARHQGILTISHDREIFRVQTALKLP